MRHARLLNDDEIEALARYNSEKSRGLVHTREWVERMEHLQAIFNAARKRVWIL